MRIVSLIWFYFFCQLVYAQQTFETIIRTELDQEAFEILVLDNGYLIPGLYYLNENETNGVSYMLDEHGILLDSILLDDNRSSMFSSSVQLQNGDIRIFGTIERDNNPGFFDLFWLDIDLEMNITNEGFLETSTGREWIKNYSLTKGNGNIVMASIIDGNPPNGSYDWDKMLLEITQDGEIIFDSIYNQSGLELVMDFILIPNSSNYLLYCLNSFEEGNITKPINILDPNYNLIENHYIEGYSFQASFKNFYDNSYISCSKSSVDKDTKEDWYTSVSIYDMNFELLDNVLLGSADTLSYPAFSTSIVIQSPSDILIGSNYNVPLSSFSSEKSYFALYKLDDNLDIQWQRFYGGDANYYFWDLKGTNDGGCIMVGTKYEHGETGPFERDVIVIKVDEYGLITNTNEAISTPIKNAIITPNPGIDYLQLHTGIYPSQFLLFNMFGQLILEEDIQQNITSISVQPLSSGTYIWSLIKDGQVVENGKWIKE